MNVVISGGFLPDLPRIVGVIGVSVTDFDWHIANVEAAPWDAGSGQGWFSGDELASRFANDPVDIYWGVFDAFPAGMRPNIEVQPWADGNASVWDADARPQIAGAKFEVVYWDSGDVILIGLTEGQAASVTNVFSDTRIG